MLSCAGCGVAYFCSKECQAKNWKTHALCCKKLRAGSERVEAQQQGPKAPAQKAPKVKGRNSTTVGFGEPFGVLDRVAGNLLPASSHATAAAGIPQLSQLAMSPSFGLSTPFSYLPSHTQTQIHTTPYHTTPHHTTPHHTTPHHTTPHLTS